MKVKIGFTGTRNGMTMCQRMEFVSLITGGGAAARIGMPEAFYDASARYSLVESFHHGDCVGADNDAASEVSALRVGTAAYRDIAIVCHPPIDKTHRAFHCGSTAVLEPKSHFARNRDIVNETDMLIATPWQMERPAPKTGGGTWYTVEYAEKQGKRVVIIWPDGNVSLSPQSQAKGEG